jgi:SOS-response transcriptional repressor LexA
MLAEWLNQVLAETGISKTELAKRLTQRLGRSIDRSAVSKMSTGIRSISADELMAIEEITGRTAPGRHDGVKVIEPPLAGLPVLGTIQAGAWLDTTLIDPIYEPEMLQVIPDKRFPLASQYVLLVVGDSMDLEYPDGSYVTCVDFAESGLSLREGMIVHVERREAGGQRAEITLKQVERNGRGFYLVPRSNNPRWQPIELAGDADTSVVVRGIVTGGWAARRIPR